LVLHRGGRPDTSESIFWERRRFAGDPSVRQHLRQRIAARVGDGGSFAEVEREIIAPAARAGVGGGALRRYARIKLRLATGSRRVEVS
jgi:hypothetical protein